MKTKKYICNDCYRGTCRLEATLNDSNGLIKTPEFCQFSKGERSRYFEEPETGKDIDVPTRIPDWLVVGAWIWEPSSERYFRVAEIDGKNVTCDGGLHTNDPFCLVQARVLPWTFTEAPMMLKVKRIILGKSPLDYLCLRLLCIDNEGIVMFECTHGYGETAAGLVSQYVQLDGSPCGTGQHMNSNGEWVQ